MPIRSLHTTYAGCRFRSRLEARWAVWLDHLGIAWEYEPQGFEVTNRLRLDDAPDSFNYLPDFWLPEHGYWFEVKGELDNKTHARLLTAAASLSSNDGGGCHDAGGNDLAVAGPLTANVGAGIPVLLHMHKGDLEATCLLCGKHAPGVLVALDEGFTYISSTTLLRGVYCRFHSTESDVISAFDAARTARFEHGAKPRKANKA